MKDVYNCNALDSDVSLAIDTCFFRSMNNFLRRSWGQKCTQTRTLGWDTPASHVGLNSLFVITESLLLHATLHNIAWLYTACTFASGSGILELAYHPLVDLSGNMIDLQHWYGAWSYILFLAGGTADYQLGKKQFSHNHWSQAMLNLVTSWMGDCSSVAWVMLLTLRVG